MKYKITDKNTGFTLIELIIVIVIIAILTGVSVSGYSKYVGQAKVSSDINNVEIVSKAMNTALAEDGVYEELLGMTASDKIIVCISNTGADIQNYDPNSSYMRAINDYLEMTDGHRDALKMSALKTFNNSDCYYIVAIPVGDGTANVIVTDTP